jgi:hypothetical protein
VPHSNNLEDQAKELHVAVAFTWVLLPLLRFISGFSRLSLFHIFWLVVVHISVEADAKFLTRGSLNWVRVKGTREHIVEVGYSSQRSVAHNN